jgi:hypothetical protein
MIYLIDMAISSKSVSIASDPSGLQGLELITQLCLIQKGIHISADTEMERYFFQFQQQNTYLCLSID